MGVCKFVGMPLMHGRDEVGLGDRPSLAIGDRDQRHLAEAEIERLEMCQTVGSSLDTADYHSLGHLEKLLSIPIACDPGVNVNQSERERSGIICRQFCGAG